MQETLWDEGCISCRGNWAWGRQHKRVKSQLAPLATAGLVRWAKGDGNAYITSIIVVCSLRNHSSIQEKFQITRNYLIVAPLWLYFYTWSMSPWQHAPITNDVTRNRLNSNKWVQRFLHCTFHSQPVWSVHVSLPSPVAMVMATTLTAEGLCRGHLWRCSESNHWKCCQVSWLCVPIPSSFPNNVN